MFYIFVFGNDGTYWLEYDDEIERDSWLEVLQNRFGDCFVRIL